MKVFFIFIGTMLLTISSLTMGCKNCEEKEIASLLDSPSEDDILSDTHIDYRELNLGISCLNSNFSNIVNTYDESSLRSAYQSITANAEYGNFIAAILVLKDELTLTELRSAGCLDEYDDTIQIDWTTQTLIVAYVASTSGCSESTKVSLQENFENVPYLKIAVQFVPTDGCDFELKRAVIVDAKDINTELSLVAGCNDDNYNPE